MSRTVLDHAAKRIAEHAAAHELGSVRIILHGGEPLLAGPDLLGYAVGAVRDAAGPEVRVDATVQSNGTHLDAPFLELFREIGVRVGVSVDGGAAGQDRHRTYASGRGSHAAVDPAIRLLAAERYRDVFAGLLCTIDVRNDPVATYEALLGYDPPAVDFLLPHGHWATPPPFRAPGAADTPYGDWLAAIFDRWYHAPVRETRVRLFTEIMHAILGGESTTESIGLSPVAVAVIEADGVHRAVGHPEVGVPGCAVDRAAHRPRRVRRRAAAAADRCPPAPGGGAAEGVPRLRGAAGLRRRPVRAPLPAGHGLPQPERVLPRPAPAHRPRPLGDGGRHRGHPGPQAMSLRRHRIPADLLALLAEGGGGPAAIRRLAAIDLSRRMLLVSGVVTVSRQSGRAAHDLASQAYELLAAVQQEAPRAVDAVLRHPAVGAWAWRTVLAASSGRPSRLADPAGLALVAGAAAVRARFPCDLPVPVTDGAVMLPSLGQALVPPQTGDRLPRLRSRPDGATVLAGGARVPIPADPHRDAAGWHGLRAISATADGAAIRLVIDDLDPHRMPLPTLRGLARR